MKWMIAAAPFISASLVAFSPMAYAQDSIETKNHEIHGRCGSTVPTADVQDNITTKSNRCGCRCGSNNSMIRYGITPQYQIDDDEKSQLIDIGDLELIPYGFTSQNQIDDNEESQFIDIDASELIPYGFTPQ